MAAAGLSKRDAPRTSAPLLSEGGHKARKEDVRGHDECQPEALQEPGFGVEAESSNYHALEGMLCVTTVTNFLKLGD